MLWVHFVDPYQVLYTESFRKRFIEPLEAVLTSGFRAAREALGTRLRSVPA